ncbi:MAG: hypothetical protein Q8896_04670 [Bacteroidota bacterium]|nr:hypothetical protein [Bacteroidota bacterium]
MRQASIDIGTNTCLLLIAESDRIGQMKCVADVHSIARLGAGVDETKRIQPEAYERLRNILTQYQGVLKAEQIDAVAAIGTSALRDATNRDEIVERIRDEFTLDVEILSGADESKWSYRGAMCGLRRDDLQGAIGSLDIGGGSTELAAGSKGEYAAGISMNIGAVRITERYLSSINDASITSAREFIESEITRGFKNPLQLDKLIAVAGTPTSLAAMKLNLASFDPHKVNGAKLTTDDLAIIMTELLALKPSEITEKYPAVHSSRADILPAGAMILQEIMKYLGLDEVSVSTCGLRYGIMIREFERRMQSTSDQWLVNPG